MDEHINHLVLWMYIIGNTTIALGYGSIPALVLPYLPLTRTVLIFGAGFFALCGLTHAGMALGHTPHMGGSTFWAVEHLLQAIATWGFIITFHRLLRNAARRKAMLADKQAARHRGEVTPTPGESGVSL